MVAAAARGGPSPASHSFHSSYEFWQTLARAIEEGGEEEGGEEEGGAHEGGAQAGGGQEGAGPLSEARQAEVVAVLRDGIAHHPKEVELYLPLRVGVGVTPNLTLTLILTLILILTLT